MVFLDHDKAWRVVSVLFLVSLNLLQSLVLGAPQVPCYFIFGDSLADNGNNNNLLTLAKSNYPPYGIDFPGGATGRFTNGRTSVDIIGQLLGFDKFIPPFATARGNDILQGLNYASGAAGIRDESGQQLGDRISFNRQLENHLVTVSSVRGILGWNASASLNECIYTVGMGNNDYINNYFMPDKYPPSRIYTPEQYADVLIKQYKQQLKTLYFYGARKVAVIGLGLIGCTPTEIKRFGTNGSVCVDKINNAVTLFNNRLQPLVDEFNSNLSDAKFTYINMFAISTTGPGTGDLILNATCCKVDEELGTCIPFETPCSSRSSYVFYDGFHPSEVTNLGFAARAFNALLPSDASPYDIRKLAMI
ncbi:GDSL esterase/lipase At5g45670-like [Syzygium oleosum]|uniref:GDSL esterase/lipase At5g45670-like n=1 Tax=Syzygium oleosum TaxID=219896 RepID=UPI0024BA9684|nr:GDSL esterase/lipase At5g45670-like [Syzygium oleosum]